MIFVTGPFRCYTACNILCLPTVAGAVCSRHIVSPRASRRAATRVAALEADGRVRRLGQRRHVRVPEGRRGGRCGGGSHGGVVSVGAAVAKHRGGEVAVRVGAWGRSGLECLMSSVSDFAPKCDTAPLLSHKSFCITSPWAIHPG